MNGNSQPNRRESRGTTAGAAATARAETSLSVTRQARTSAWRNWATWLTWMTFVVVFGSVSIVPAGPNDKPVLDWGVETDSGALTVQRAESGTLWQGETLAEISYWDTNGAERSLALAAAGGP